MSFDFTTQLRTLDHAVVTEGGFYFDYDLDLVRIETGELHKKLHVDYGQPESEAWFNVTKLSTGSQKLMNATRLWKWEPDRTRSAAHVAISKDMAVEVLPGRTCDVHELDQRVQIPAVGDFRTHDGRWADLCESHRRQLTDGKAGLGIGQYFIVMAR